MAEASQQTTNNAWCRTLGIKTPRLEAVKEHRQANTF
jgi:hypothetical protein